MWGKLSRRERVLLILFAFILLLTVYYFYIYLPLSEEVAILQQRKISKELELKHTTHLMARLPEAEQEYSQLKELELTAGTDPLTIDQFLKDLADNSTRNRLALKSFIPYQAGGNYTINFVISGVYSDILLLLDWLGKYQFILEFRELTIKSATGGEIEMTVKVSYDKEQANGGDSR